MLDVMEMNAITPLTGFMIENNAVKTEIKNVTSEIISSPISQDIILQKEFFLFLFHHVFAARSFQPQPPVLLFHMPVPWYYDNTVIISNDKIPWFYGLPPALYLCIYFSETFWLACIAVSYTHLRAHETRHDL